MSRNSIRHYLIILSIKLTPHDGPFSFSFPPSPVGRDVSVFTMLCVLWNETGLQLDPKQNRYC